MKLEWDETKNTANIQKHGFDFNDVQELFAGDRLTFLDERVDYGESRFIALGYLGGRCVVAVYTERSSSIRMISLRKANNREKERFEKAVKNRLGAG